MTVIDGKDRSKGDLETRLLNAIAASQSRQEQIDKAERVLVGKQQRAVLGEYIGSKYLVFGFDVVCALARTAARSGVWSRMRGTAASSTSSTTQASTSRLSVTATRSSRTPTGSCPTRKSGIARRRTLPTASSTRRRSGKSRWGRLRRICEWFDAGWTTYRIAQQLNDEKIKPVYSDPLVTRGLHRRPAWRTAVIVWQARRGTGPARATSGTLRAARSSTLARDRKGVHRLNDQAEWSMPTDEVFEPFIDHRPVR